MVPWCLWFRRGGWGWVGVFWQETPGDLAHAPQKMSWLNLFEQVYQCWVCLSSADLCHAAMGSVYDIKMADEIPDSFQACLEGGVCGGGQESGFVDGRKCYVQQSKSVGPSGWNLILGLNVRCSGRSTGSLLGKSDGISLLTTSDRCCDTVTWRHWHTYTGIPLEGRQTLLHHSLHQAFFDKMWRSSRVVYQNDLDFFSLYYFFVSSEVTVAQSCQMYNNEKCSCNNKNLWGASLVVNLILW